MKKKREKVQWKEKKDLLPFECVVLFNLQWCIWIDSNGLCKKVYVFISCHTTKFMLKLLTDHRSIEIPVFHRFIPHIFNAVHYPPSTILHVHKTGYEKTTFKIGNEFLTIFIIISTKKTSALSTRLYFTIWIVALWTFRKGAYDGFHITAIFDLVDPYPKRQISGIFFPVCQCRIAKYLEPKPKPIECCCFCFHSAMAYVPKWLHARLHFSCASDSRDM